MGSAGAHPYSSHTTKRSFSSHTLLLLLLSCSGAPQTFPREQKPPPVWVCLFYQWHWEWVWECDKCWGQQQLGGRVCSSGLVWDSTATPFLCWWVAWAAKAGLCNFPFPCVEQELPPMALMFTSWISQPKPLEWENCCIFLPFTKRKKKAKTKTPLWSLKTLLSKAKWLRLPDSCRGLRIGAVKGCVTEVMHQEGSPLLLAWYLSNPQLCVCSGNACGPQSVFCCCSWGLLGLCVLSASWPSCIFSGGCHCGSAWGWDGSLHLRWLFAFDSKGGGTPSSLLWPFLSCF